MSSNQNRFSFQVITLNSYKVTKELRHKKLVWFNLDPTLKPKTSGESLANVIPHYFKNKK